ncbi:MAG: tRNA (N(6)-L-threonylcarbamoyladenosine(37)-C(2))-methylthiotransferase MtaB [Spirochaetales bacterium]|nr:tRNA (N(6)-L-threonylcarbamoyladenosine(37)-C(2))-methylthiotransferase MtaB [Spirochaetales bacterium]
MKPGVAFRTFGCRLNQLETEAMAAAFDAAGFASVPFGAGAFVTVLNTCTVTGKAEQKARREIRAALRGNPDGLVLVTGCYAEVEGEALAALGERAVVVPGSAKDRVLDLASRLAEAAEHGLDPVDEARAALDAASGRVRDPFAFAPGRFAFHARPALKIQDGCDNACTYCRVRIARGRAVSLSAAEVLSRARSLADSGAAEIVLTGVNLSQYRDPDTGAGFAGLLETLLAGTDSVAYRISSWEPDRVDGGFASVFADPRVRAHVHLALQSGCDATLGRMARPYRTAKVREAVALLRAARPGFFLGVDLILGFPGETDAEFAETLSLLDELRPAWIHAFPYSPRPGTKAAVMGGKVPERVAGERVALVTNRARAWRSDYALSRVGLETEVVLEGQGGAGYAGEDEAEAPGGEALPGCGRAGTSGEFLGVLVHGLPPDLDRPGVAVRVSLEQAMAGGDGLGVPDLRGRFVAPAGPGSLLSIPGVLPL